jgi:hypothetical protein
MLGVAPLVSSGARFTFFDMAPFNATLRGQLGAEQWQRRREAVLHPVAFRWLPTFHALEESEAEGVFRWCGQEGEVHVTNPSSQPRQVVVQMTCKTHVPGRWHLRIEGALWPQTVEVTTQGQVVTQRLLVPPGTQVLRFTCDSPLVPMPSDPRPLAFRVLNFTCREEF